MLKVFSLPISIGPIVAISIAGIFTYTGGYTVWSYILRGLAAIWLIISFVLTCRNSKKAQEEQRNWIERYFKKHGEMPVLPKKLIPLVDNYSEGEKVTKNIRILTPSGQLWNGLADSEKKQWEELVLWKGENPQDHLDRMRQMLPKDPKLGSKNKPFEQH